MRLREHGRIELLIRYTLWPTDQARVHVPRVLLGETAQDGSVALTDRTGSVRVSR